VTTLPGLPELRISLVLDTFKEILNMVVKRIIEGNADIFSTFLANMALNKTTIETDIFKASRISSIMEFMGIIRKMIADNINKPTTRSFLFIPFLQKYS